ncbi:DNA mismatch repair endonuclease MutL [Salicibibacter halophilus]|uniref:DNA mismatch repair protein MutL n=1 Tax=Salicibibacter halophilus TaxID=2502791 RepID=A0A514LE91_9BACI|nr:DNA mismatch repair endonuclease MutL [Salicibibacter halophilus]QDI90172.1 DNA mismatch repair endonuclease MutL [Salicibibacter halophilus]
MSAIVTLEETLSNKIAAGEVVERPASVVKELVENALDAGSTRIDIDLQDGGLSRIHVLDNGGGIAPEDAELAFLRHATSKIKNEDDLHHIQTLGFRGEALPSIASVSKLTLETAQNQEAGIHLRYQGGRLIARAKSKARQGTSVLVEELFFNTPARLKYMKTVNTELGNATDIVNRVALARPDVSFRLIHNERQVLFTNGNGDRRAVLYAIYGKQVAKNMLTATRNSQDFEISGFMAKPEINRASRHYMSVFINGRYIKHFPLLKAIEKAYQTLLPIHRYPIAAVAITMNPALVDVNVHPSKWDVRISKEETLLLEVTEMIRECLQQETLIPEQTERSLHRPVPEKPREEVRELPLTFANKPEQYTPTSSSVTGQNIEQNKKESVLNAEEEHLTVEKNKPHPPHSDVVAQEEGREEEEQVHEGSDTEAEWQRVPVLYPIGQLHGTYILAQNDQGLYLIDQHAAQERIHYEYYRDKLGDPEQMSQSLLVPFTMTFTPQEAARIEELGTSLGEMGIHMEAFGVHTYRVRAHPTWIPKGMEEETIQELIAQLLSLKKPDIPELREEAAALTSCKAAIKANRHLRSDEMFALLEEMRACKNPFTCPHGRPIYVHITSYELEKMFKRVM